MTTITFTYDESVCHYFTLRPRYEGYECYMGADHTQFTSTVSALGWGATPQEAATAAEHKLRHEIEKEHAKRAEYKASLAAVPEISLDDFNL